MDPFNLDLARRRPVWEALADLFLDTQLDDRDYQSVAHRILESGFDPAEVRAILWKEVFPPIECNLRHPAGEWMFFPGEWMEKLIFGPSTMQTAEDQPRTASIIREAWADVCRFLPEDFRVSGDPL